MRRLIVVLSVAAASLSAQEPARLDVSLHYTGYGRPEFTTTKPAFVAVFDVSRNGLRQLYPMGPEQVAETQGWAYMPSVSNSASWWSHVGVFGNPYVDPGIMLASFRNSMGGYGGWRYALATPLSASSLSFTATTHTLVVVASSKPLRLTSPWSTPNRLFRRLQAAGLYFDIASDSAISTIIDEVAPTGDDAETVATWDEFSYPQYSMYSDMGRYTLYLGCLNAGGLGYYYQTDLDSWYCRMPVTGVTAEARARRDTTVADSGAGVARTGVITDPAEIRRIIQSAAEAERRSGQGLPGKLGGAETATRFDDPRDANTIGGGRFAPDARSSARVSGPVDNARPAPAVSGTGYDSPPRKMEPPPAPVAPVHEAPRRMEPPVMPVRPTESGPPPKVEQPAPRPVPSVPPVPVVPAVPED